MESLQLNNNMLRGVLGYQIAKCISESMTIQKIGLSGNFLGYKAGKSSSSSCKEPPVNNFAELFIYSKFLERIDLGYNHITQKSCYCLSQGLSISQSVQYISLEGNPIGNIGTYQIIKAKNENEYVDFEINLRDVGGEIATASENESKIKLFDPAKPEGKY